MRPKKLCTNLSFLVFAVLSLVPLRASAQSSNAVPRITQAVDETRLTVLPGNTYPLARSEYDRGPAPSSLPMERMMLVLRRSPEQEAALETRLREQLDKSSPNFHKWLTPEQYGQQFGPADQDIQTVTSWLGSHGFQVAGASKGRTIIEFSGDAGQVQEAFHTPIHMFVVNGQEHWANANDPKIPTALTPVIVGVDTLHNFPRKPAYQYAGRFTREKATGKVTPIKPEFTFAGGCFGAGTNCYAVGPYDFATIYNVLPLWNSSVDGSGVIIGVSAQTDINPTDYSDFRGLFGLPYTPSTNYLNIIHNGADPGTTEDESEGDIDSQWSGAVAKGATIDFVVSSSVDHSAEYIIDNNLSDILTESYGECELGLGTAGNQFYNSLWQQASAEGISVFVSAGDNGSAGCDNDDAEPPHAALYGLQVSGFASTPYNVAVGGTDFNDGANELTYWSTTNNSTQASALGYIPEVIWNNSCTNPVFVTLGYGADAVANCNNSQLEDAVVTVGGSGGPSSCTVSDGSNPSNCTVGSGYPKPTWQTGPGVPSDGVRDIPDVSLFAGNGFQGNFYIVCQLDGNVPANSSCNLNSPFTDFAGFGGTSVSAPAMAGIMAMVVQKSGRQGNPNPFLYNLATESGASCNSASPTSSCIFYDLAAGAGTNAMPCANASPNCTVASGDTYGVLPGFATTAGYDQASGLGSVNAANLVNSSWPVSHTADYNVSFSPTLLTIAALGDSGTVTLTVNPLNGYAGAVSFASAKCTNLPANTTCTFASLSSTTATITVQTTKTANVFPHSRPASFGNWAVSDGIVRTVVLSLGLLIFGFQAKRRQWSRVAGFLVAAFLIATVACGGGGGGGGVLRTPPPPVVSNQPIVVTVTDGAIIHSATFLLTID